MRFVSECAQVRSVAGWRRELVNLCDDMKFIIKFELSFKMKSAERG